MVVNVSGFLHTIGAASTYMPVVVVVVGVGVVVGCECYVTDKSNNGNRAEVPTNCTWHGATSRQLGWLCIVG